MNDTPVACQTRGPTDPQGDRWHGEAVADEGSLVPRPARRRRPHTTAALAATYPLRCSAPQWARFDNRQRLQRTRSYPHCCQRQRRRDSFAPRRELLLSAVTKVAKSTGRNCVSALPQRATVGCDFPHLLAGITFHHRCQSKGLRVRSPARRLTRPLASATAEIFRSCRRTPKPSPRVAHSLKPSP